MANLTDIGNEIHQELGSPNDLAAGLIVSWLRNNIGLLNDNLNISYSIDATNGELIPDMIDIEKVIFKKMYSVYYYEKKLRDVLNMATNDSIIEVTENGATVRRLNKTEQAKVYAAVKKDETNELIRLINAYKINGSTPLSVDGEDNIPGIYNPTYNTTRYPLYQQ